MVFRKEGATVTVRLQPRSSRPGLKGVSNNVLELRVAAPPVDGRANEEARRLLAGLFGVAKSAVSIAAGQTSRNKVFVIAGRTAGDLEKRLTELSEKT